MKGICAPPPRPPRPNDRSSWPSTTRRPLDSALTGGKAAALARGKSAGLASLPGVVLTTAFSDAVDAGAELQDARRRPRRLRPGGRRRAGVGRPQLLGGRGHGVVVDGRPVRIRDRHQRLRRIRRRRGGRARLARRAGAADQPIAVLVQPLIEPAYGGVMFGIDPVTGRTDRRVVSAVTGGPERLVSGEVDGSRYVLDPATAKVLEFAANDGPKLESGHLRRLVDLSAQVASVYGGPQDVEWAIATDGTLWLLQSRPVTTDVRGVPAVRSTGPGLSPRRSPIPSPSSRPTCGCPHFEKRWAKRSCWPAPPPQRTWPPARSLSASTDMWRSTCAWPGS